MEERDSFPKTMRLRSLLAARDHDGFLEAFCKTTAAGWGRNDQYLKALGGEGLCLLFERGAKPSLEHATRYAELITDGLVAVPSEFVDQLVVLLQPELPDLASNLRSSIQPSASSTGETNLAAQSPDRAVLKVRRVVQFMHMFLGDENQSDSLGVRRSIFRSQQERRFLRALTLRFPGLLALPNYPLDQIIDLNRIAIDDARTQRYGRRCRLDAILVIPDEGDPVAAFELDSDLHDRIITTDRDVMKNRLLAATGLPFFRLRAESPQSMTTDEWYALLTDEVFPFLDPGRRIRCRDATYRLIPC